MIALVGRLLGKAMLTETEKETSRKHRKYFHPSFEKRYRDQLILKCISTLRSIRLRVQRNLVEFTKEIDSKANKLIDRLRSYAYENRAFKLNDEIFNTVLDIIADVKMLN